MLHVSCQSSSDDKTCSTVYVLFTISPSNCAEDIVLITKGQSRGTPCLESDPPSISSLQPHPSPMHSCPRLRNVYAALSSFWTRTSFTSSPIPDRCHLRRRLMQLQGVVHKKAAAQRVVRGLADSRTRLRGCHSYV